MAEFKFLHEANLPEGTQPFCIDDLVRLDTISTPAQGFVPESFAHEFWLPKTSMSLPRFLAGECLRGRCRFVTSQVKKVDPSTVNKFSRKDTIIFRETYHCCFGPDGSNSSCIPVSSSSQQESDPAPQESRRCSKAINQHSIKVGCTCHSTVRQYWQVQPEMLRVSYYGSMKHVNQNGALCHGPGCSTCLPMHAVEPGISDGCRSLVTDILRRSPKATHVEIIAAVMGWLLADILLEHGLDKTQHNDLMEALTLKGWDKPGAAPRDLFISHKDVQNLRAKLPNTWSCKGDDAAAVAQWVN